MPRKAEPKREAEGFEFLSPWMPALYKEGFYIVAVQPRSGKLYRWRLWRVHDKSPATGEPLVYWILDESSAAVDAMPEGALHPTAQTWDEPKRLGTPRDKGEASETVLARWAELSR